MKITVIGHWGAYPEADEATSCYLFESNGFRFILDCGSGALSKLQKFCPIAQLDAVVISHYHHDHIADIGPLQYGRLVQKYLKTVDKELPIYGHDFDKKAFAELTKPSISVGIAYDPTKELQVGPFTITFMKTKHPAVCFAMRITDGVHTAVYTADSSYLEEFIPFSQNTDILISECSFYEDQDGTDAGHMNSSDAGKIASKANVHHLLLTHLPHFGNATQLKEEAQKEYSGKIELAQHGWSWSMS